MTTEFSGLWENNPQLHQLWGTKRSFYTWIGMNKHKLMNKSAKYGVKDIIALRKQGTQAYQHKKVDENVLGVKKPGNNRRKPAISQEKHWRPIKYE